MHGHRDLLVVEDKIIVTQVANMQIVTKLFMLLQAFLQGKATVVFPAEFTELLIRYWDSSHV